jgi:hypothetical protein
LTGEKGRGDEGPTACKADLLIGWEPCDEQKPIYEIVWLSMNFAKSTRARQR